MTVKLDIAGDPAAVPAPGKPREKSCSGALLSASWVISAASCFAETPGAAVSAGAPKWVTTATVGRADLTGTSGHVVQVDRLVPHPDRDVVLVHLAAPVRDVAAAKVASAAPQVGEELAVAGFGRTADRVVPDTAHVATFTVGSVAVGTIDIEADQAGATICKGDAGGPALRTTSTGVELVAIHHTAYQGGCLGATSTRQDATETRVDDLRDWVDRSTAPKPGQAEFNDAYVASVYRHVLGREAGASEIAVWTSAIGSGASLQMVAEGVTGSAEWRNRFVDEQYRLLLGRPADAAGLATWGGVLDQGKGTFAVTQGIVGSAEYFARAGSDDAGLVKALYRDLLGREAGAGEVSAWSATVATYGRDALLSGIVNSPEHQNRVVDQRYRQMLGRPVDPAGLTTSVDALSRGGTVQQLLARLAGSGEYTDGRVRAL
ncbi:DUF4214 domain-containing protein [Cellulomonas dongxiuzhuiae]|uniref:DUF4214 domain-containing protein n=1 Tax=Cellulomonas dongxiuzhuiae TaxID=2819979 RepID=A0ABX8GNE3_9CELL|nr:DUF4214 domain-containing protein [Cellulomonas dongxiuzhuiae]MBO3095880.1 DUF4214 domain-containing protein [Cellulomonas dongxiuzhuiae]QWC17182.1 DUF4214 domain-containing protein [Cellulomonas dongxiuzhuiae]